MGDVVHLEELVDEVSVEGFFSNDWGYEEIGDPNEDEEEGNFGLSVKKESQVDGHELLEEKEVHVGKRGVAVVHSLSLQPRVEVELDEEEVEEEEEKKEQN